MRIWLSSWAIESIVEGDVGPDIDDGRDKALGSTDALLARALGVGLTL